LFEWLKSKPTQQRVEIRDTLFGDMPLTDWIRVPAETMASEPWASFGRAKQLIDSGDTGNAAVLLQKVLETPQLESRHYLQAYSFLRALGVNPPPEKAKDVLGVVVEVAMKRGLDLVAGYADHHARYYNYSGAGVVWERPNGTLDAAIDDLLRVGAVVARAIGPWKEARPPAPPEGNTRINLLVPSGLHFGEGPLETLERDRLGGPVIASALRLMLELVKLTKK